ncbi:Exonuclease [Leishmania donovani]|uniref:Exonuclease_putative/Pfam:PF00929 n=1 Tax=Leishmania donovani TaxID=5661 RepID=A0A6J8FDI7_LEIDO|nr:Exonuclease [Leishmania donovani]VDZ45339.1 Exonuclease_putative/Pfam:PF00929 [Leishmania donovani]
MLRRSHATLRRKASVVLKGQLNPLEALTQIQLGMTPSLPIQRGFLLEHCERQLESLGITEGKLLAMDGRLCTQLTKRIVYELYLSVPFRVFTFDMEFTGPPVFTADGPTEDITELGLYSPLLDETFSCLVQPVCGRKQGPGVEELTHITDMMLEKEGIPFVEAWQQFLNFVQTPQPDEISGSEERILLLSHGGKLADVSLIKWTLEKFHMELPPSFVFGDTIHLIRDAHRRRPVTIDKHPPSWKLVDLVQWLHIPPTLPAHRAGNDARMTWDALYHTLLRYGDDEMAPREQLVPRFFDAEAKQLLREHTARQAQERAALSLDDTFLLADVSHSASAGHADSSSIGYSAYRSASDGSGKPCKSGAATDLLDLDFDDIFSEQNKVSASAPIEEFKLDDDDDLHSISAGASSFTASRTLSSTTTSRAAALSIDAAEDDDAVSDVNAASTPTVSPDRAAKKATSGGRKGKASGSSRSKEAAEKRNKRRGSAGDDDGEEASDPPAAATRAVFLV